MHSLKLDVLLAEIEKQKCQWLDELQHVIALKTVPFQKGQHQAAMVQWLAKKLCQLNAVVEILETGANDMDYEQYGKPKLILAHIKHKHAKETVLIYGHIDTNNVESLHQAEKQHEMNREPFKLTQLDGKLYGHGLTHGKGPLMSWLHAIEALNSTDQKPNVNIKFIIETLRTAKSQQLEQLMRMRQRFFQNVQYVCLLEQTTINVKQLPVICNSISGSVKFVVELHAVQPQPQQPAQPTEPSLQHAQHEPLQELTKLIDAMTDDQGCLLLSKRAQLAAEVGDTMIPSKHMPRLCMYNVKGTFANVCLPKITPPQVTAKFSIEFNAAYDSGFLIEYVASKLAKLYKSLAGENTLIVTAKHLVRPWLLQPNENMNFKTIERALTIAGNSALLLAAIQHPHYVADVLREFTKCDALIFNLFSSMPKCDELDNIDEAVYWNAVKELAIYLRLLGAAE